MQTQNHLKRKKFVKQSCNTGENKFREKEDDLKIKEKMLVKMDPKRVWFKSHIQRLENKINELEKKDPKNFFGSNL